MQNKIEELFREFCENQCQEKPENKRYHMPCVNCKAEEFADWLEQRANERNHTESCRFFDPLVGERLESCPMIINCDEVLKQYSAKKAPKCATRLFSCYGVKNQSQCCKYYEPVGADDNIKVEK